VTEDVTVELGARSYAVAIGGGLLREAGSRLRPFVKRGRVAVVTDRHVEALHGATLARALREAGIEAPTIVIEPGESAKSFAGLESLCAELLALGLERGDLVVAFGGGVVGDLAGFAAAIYKRGIDFAQIPTTLLAQVDSSVGGKTAIDTPAGKNMIGAFHQPRLVLADLDMLETLPDRELTCGLGEVLKYGLLGDAEFFAWLEVFAPDLRRRDPAALTHAVRRSVEMKAAVVARDEREGGARALLNLGHTFAHAIEAETGFGDALKHGEAVGLGCAMAFRLSARLGLCDAGEADRATIGLVRAGLPTFLTDLASPPLSADALLGHMRQDKKASSGGLTLILTRAIGDAFVATDVDPAALRDFLVAEGAAS
jgi:3-dehydroquinate synthase